MKCFLKLIFSLVLFIGVQLMTPHFASAADTGAAVCIKLEGLSIGCVPSVDHPCFRNKNPEAEGRTAGACGYYPEGAFAPPPASDSFFDKTTFAQAGPISFKCQTYKPGSTCTPSGGDVDTCPQSECLVFFQPVCVERCEWCIKDIKAEPQKTAGCIVCTRPYCDDEPTAGPYCPAHPTSDSGVVDLTYSLPDNGFPKCPAQITPRKCEPTIRPPTGTTCSVMDSNGQCVVRVTAAECGPRPPVKKRDGTSVPRSCPWITDQRTYDPEVPATPGPAAPAVNHCEPVVAPNRFPQDCVGGPPCG